jgi:transposase
MWWRRPALCLWGIGQSEPEGEGAHYHRRTGGVHQRHRHLYKERHLVENFFARLKQFRAIATRYDKTARNFLAAVYLTACVIWLN